MSKETKHLMGNFVDAGDGFHKAEGIAKVVNLTDGKTFLRLENLKTTNGPDLYVYLSYNINHQGVIAISIGL